MSRNKAVFLDKDGTLIENIAYNADPGKLKFYPDVPGTLKLLSDRGYKLVLVSNQAGVAFGRFEADALRVISDAMQRMLAEHSVGLDGFYYCPHHPQGKVKDYAINCECRKPGPGLILRAAEDMAIDLSRSWMIGDILNDVEAGNRAGCRTMLIDNGNETEWVPGEYRIPTCTVKCLYEAAEIILGNKDCC